MLNRRWEALEKLIRGEGRDWAAGKSGGVARDEPIRAAGCRSRSLKRIFVINDATAQSRAGFRVAQRRNLRPTENLMNGGESGPAAGLAFRQVKDGSESMGSNDNVAAEKIAPFECLLGGGAERLSLLDDIEQDIGIEKDAHANSDAVFFPVMGGTGCIGRFSRSQLRDTGKPFGPSASTGALPHRNLGGRGWLGAIGCGQSLRSSAFRLDQDGKTGVVQLSGTGRLC